MVELKTIVYDAAQFKTNPTRQKVSCECGHLSGGYVEFK